MPGCLEISQTSNKLNNEIKKITPVGTELRQEFFALKTKVGLLEEDPWN